MDFLCFKKEIVVCFSMAILSVFSHANTENDLNISFFPKKNETFDKQLLEMNVSKYKKFSEELTKNRISLEGKTYIEKHMKFLDSRESKLRIKKIQDEFLKSNNINLSDYNISLTSATPKDIFNSKKYFLCISSSMPPELIKNYFKQIEEQKLSIEIVMNGFVGGMQKIKKTIAFINKILIKDKDELYNVKVQINPKIFMYFSIKAVPALVVAENFDKSLILQESYVDSPSELNATIVYGAASLKAMMKKAMNQN